MAQQYQAAIFYVRPSASQIVVSAFRCPWPSLPTQLPPLRWTLIQYSSLPPGDAQILGLTLLQDRITPEASARQANETHTR